MVGDDRRMPLPRLMATDLDGTLLGDEHELSYRTAVALSRVRAAGVTVVAVTARPPRVFEEFTRLAELLDAVICSNGALRYDQVLRVAIPGITLAVETGREVVAESTYLRVDRVAGRRAIVAGMDEVLDYADPIVKLLAHCPRRYVDVLLAAARPALSAELTVSHSGGRGLLELSSARVSKAVAVAQWCIVSGITAAEVIAFGDMPNDVPMLRWAGTSYAMANVHPEALAAAGHRTLSNREDGVAVVLERLLDNV
jgi:HAD superfamily hydrolase (TIGR01484 family)